MSRRFVLVPTVPATASSIESADRSIYVLVETWAPSLMTSETVPVQDIEWANRYQIDLPAMVDVCLLPVLEATYRLYQTVTPLSLQQAVQVMTVQRLGVDASTSSKVADRLLSDMTPDPPMMPERVTFLRDAYAFERLPLPLDRVDLAILAGQTPDVTLRLAAYMAMHRQTAGLLFTEAVLQILGTQAAERLTAYAYIYRQAYWRIDCIMPLCVAVMVPRFTGIVPHPFIRGTATATDSGIVDPNIAYTRLVKFICREEVDVLEGLNWKGIWIMGSCMAAILPEADPPLHLYRDADLDMAVQHFDLLAKAMYIRDTIEQNLQRYYPDRTVEMTPVVKVTIVTDAIISEQRLTDLYRSSYGEADQFRRVDGSPTGSGVPLVINGQQVARAISTTTYRIMVGDRAIDVFKTSYSMPEMVKGCHFPCTRAFYDGDQFYLHSSALGAYLTMVNDAYYLHLGRMTLEQAHAKYSARGYNYTEGDAVLEPFSRFALENL